MIGVESSDVQLKLSRDVQLLLSRDVQDDKPLIAAIHPQHLVRLHDLGSLFQKTCVRVEVLQWRKRMRLLTFLLILMKVKGHIGYHFVEACARL